LQFLQFFCAATRLKLAYIAEYLNCWTSLYLRFSVDRCSIYADYKTNI